MPDPLPIEPLREPFDVTITPPGSKSITCRAYVLAALAEGVSRIVRPLRAQDTDNLLTALCALGAEASWSGDEVHLKGVGGRFPRGGEVNLGDGGAPSRFMIAAGCLAAEPVIVDGSPRMRQRPVAEMVTFLQSLGADVEYVGTYGQLPVRCTASDRFCGGEMTVHTTMTSQFITALLLVAPFLPKGVHINYGGHVTSKSYVDMTIGLMQRWGVFCHEAGRAVEVPPQRVSAAELFIQPDASSAAYWWTAAALFDGATVRTPGIGGNPRQPDVEYAERVLKLMGGESWIEGSQDVRGLGDCTVCVRGRGELRSKRSFIDMSMVPDAAVALAALVSMSESPTSITGLQTLRVKESDRIAALADALRHLGCTVKTTDDSILIDPLTRHERPAVIETRNDHRLAMAFAVLGLARPGISIRDPGCVAKSYPTFWRDLARFYG
jgi:3-phosphoshikimate 1-carboxyvinyltransferase